MTTSVFFLDTPEGKHYSVQVEARELQYADCKYLVYTYQFRMCDLLPATWQEQNCPNCTFHKSDSNFSCKLIFFAKWEHSYAYFCENINTWYDNRLNLNHSMWIQCITLQVVHTNPFNFSHSFTFDSGTWCYCKVPLSLENGDSLWLQVQLAALKQIKTFCNSLVPPSISDDQRGATSCASSPVPWLLLLSDPLSSRFYRHYRQSNIFNQTLWLPLIRGEASQSAPLRNQGSRDAFLDLKHILPLNAGRGGGKHTGSENTFPLIFSTQGMFQRSGNSSQPHICPSCQNWGEELGWEWVSGRQNKSNSERVGEGQWQWQQKQLMKTMPEFPDALKLSTLLILTCISMLCMRSPAAIKAKYISLIKLTDFSREVVRESKNKRDKKYWHRYDCLPRKMASINSSWVQCSFTVGFQPCIYRGGKGDDSCACCHVSSSIHHLW